MRRVFDGDEGRIDHALRVLAYAERIREGEGGDAFVVRAAAILHDIGIAEAERKHGSAAPKYQELEGPPVARGILEEVGAEADATDHVCRIVGSHHSAGDIDTAEFRAIWDADALVNIPSDPNFDPAGEGLPDVVERTFRTPTGLRIAQAELLR